VRCFEPVFVVALIEGTNAPGGGGQKSGEAGTDRWASNAFFAAKFPETIFLSRQLRKVCRGRGSASSAFEKKPRNSGGGGWIGTTDG
jgi:hypothetical protein